MYAFTPNKSYPYLLNVEASHLVLLKTCNTDFDKIIIMFTNQKSRRLETEWVFIDMGFYHLQGNRKSIYWIKDQIHPIKAGELTGIKVADTATKSNDDKIVKQEPVKQIIIRPEEKEEILNKLRRVL